MRALSCGRVDCAVRTSYSDCKLSQKRGSILKYTPSLIAVSTVIARFLFTISLIRLVGTSMSAASLALVMPSGLMNSSLKISPGWISSSFFVMVFPSMVVHNFYVVRAVYSPREADTPLIVNPDAILTRPVTRQGLKMIPRGDLQCIEGRCC